MILKRNRLGIAALTALLALAACTQDELTDGTGTLPEGMYPLEIAGITLRVESSGLPQTRVTENDDGTGSVWTAGDEFYVKFEGSDEVGTYRITNAETGTVKAVEPVYWQSTGTAQTVIAWYAPDADAGGMLDVADQTGGLAYVLKAEAPNVTYNGGASVLLAFTHSLVKVRVALTGDKASDVTGVEIYSYTTCTHSQGTISTEDASQNWITMHQADYNGTTYWEANVVPGTIIPDNFIRLNGSSVATVSGITDLAAGAMYTVNLNVEAEDPGYTIENGTYQVYTAEGLLAWASHVNQGNWNTNCTLTADITLTGDNNWTPVGTNLYAYSGTFDGAGYTISGMDISGTNTQGFISYLSGTVKDLTITGAKVSGFGTISGIVGQANEGSSIIGCAFSGTVTASQSYAGGIVGIATGCNITGCSASGTVSANASYAGGIVGNSDKSNLTACWSTAKATAPMYGAGCIAGSSMLNTYTACYWQNASMENWGEGAGDTGEPVEVTGSDWSAAMSAMNSALANAGYTGYQWTENTGSDKEDVPLVLEKDTEQQ